MRVFLNDIVTHGSILSFRSNFLCSGSQAASSGGGQRPAAGSRAICPPATAFILPYYRFQKYFIIKKSI